MSQTSSAPASAEHCWWEMRLFILVTTVLHTEGRTSTALPAQLALHSLHLHHSSSCPCMSHIPHAQNGYSLRTGLPSLVEISLWWFAVRGWGFGEWSHLLTYGEHTWIIASAKGIDWIHSSSISHYLLIMNTLGLFDSSLSCWHFLILLTISLQKQPDRTQMTVHWWNWSAAALSSLGRVTVALREHDYMCVYILFTKINSYTGRRINYRVGIFMWPS